VARLALAQIGGQTGDVLGAAQQAGEIAGLAVASALLLP
jgi:cobalamin synthase